MTNRRDALKLLGALGLGSLGGFITADLAYKLLTINAVGKTPQSAIPTYSVIVQPPQGPNGPRPMVISAEGEVIVDENGKIVSELGVYPTGGINELGGYTQTAGIQEAVAYLLNTGGG